MYLVSAAGFQGPSARIIFKASRPRANELPVRRQVALRESGLNTHFPEGLRIVRLHSRSLHMQASYVPGQVG